jgi:hypothetical protein
MRLNKRQSMALLRSGAAFLVTLFTSVVVAGSAEPEEESLPPLEQPSHWIRSFEPRVWTGYKDNVLLSYRNPVDSPFLAGGLDFSLYRIPVDGWEYLFLSSAEFVRYLAGRDVDQEASAIAQALAQKAWGDGWKSGLGAEYLYLNQVFDASTLEDVFTSLKLQGHSVALRPTMSKDLGSKYRLELETPIARQEFDEVVDDYWELSPKLVFRRLLDRRSDLSGYYQFAERWHDTRQARDADGDWLSRRLRFDQHEFGVAWRQHWDEAQHWRTVTKVSLQRNQDNGGGYYDYLRPQFAHSLRYRAKTWEVEADGRLQFYKYDRQPIGPPGSETREKTYLRVLLRGEKSLTLRCKAFAQYEHERALSNLRFDRYDVNTISGGLRWEF